MSLSSEASSLSTIASREDGNARRLNSMDRMYSRRSNPLSLILNELTINKLQFSKLDTLYGRTNEIKLLQQCFDRMTVLLDLTTTNHADAGVVSDPRDPNETTLEAVDIPNPPLVQQQKQQQQQQQQGLRRQVVWISGLSGTGKSALAQTVERAVIQRNKKTSQHSPHGVYVSGKFDWTHRDDANKQEPYAAISAVCQQLCRHILERRPHEGELLKHPQEHQPGLDVQPKQPEAASVGQYGFDEIRDMLESGLGSEVSVLGSLIPALEAILQSKRDGKEDMTTTETSDEVANDKHVDVGTAKSRFQYAFRRFIRVMTSCFRPLVIYLDDLQWADTGSLELLELLITDSSAAAADSNTAGSDALMLICAYRSNEVQHEDSSSRAKLLCKLIQLLPQDKENSCWDCTKISIGNMCIQDVHQLLLDLLSSHNNPAGTFALAEICHKRTHGNVFFLIQFLSMLQQTSLLHFNLGLMKWTWNIPEIETHTKAMSNVVDIVKAKMLHHHNRQGEDSKEDDHDDGSQKNHVARLVVRDLLPLASCLGFSFSKTTLQLVWKDFHQNKGNGLALECENSNISRRLTTLDHHCAETGGTTDSDVNSDNHVVEEALKVAIKEGFIEICHGSVDSNSTTTDGDVSFRWLHDTLQEAALSLIPQQDLRKFQSRVGESISRRLNFQHLGSAVFAAVNLLNEGIADLEEESERLKLAELNLLACQQAAQGWAFESAANYAAKGIEPLPNGWWRLNSQYYRLALELYSIAAEAEGGIGNIERIDALCNEVLTRYKSHPLSDKLRVYHVLLHSIAGRQDRAHEAVSLCLDVLRQLNCVFPRKRVGIMVGTVAGLLGLKSIKKAIGSDNLSQIELMQDPKRIEVMLLLDKLTTYCFVSQHPLMALTTLRNLHLTMRYGASAASPQAFAQTGLVFTGILGDLQGGALFGRHALLLLEKLKRKSIEARTKFIVYSLVLPWTTPISSMLKPLFNCYETGIQTGDTETAFFASSCWLLSSLQSGRSLAVIEQDYQTYQAQALELGRDRVHLPNSVGWQIVLNLIGRSEDQLSLLGAVFNPEAALKIEEGIKATIDLYRMWLYTIFGAHELGAALAIANGDSYAKKVPGISVSMVDAFNRGISLFAMARRTKQKIYKKHALKVAAIVKDWFKKGNPNVGHFKAIFDAEASALNGKKHAAKKFYEEAIILASRSGFIQDAALGSERFGEFLLHDMDDRHEAMYRLRAAMNLYREWGAIAKAELLEAKYTDLWTSSSEPTQQGASK
jgi:predicted ATPase